MLIQNINELKIAAFFMGCSKEEVQVKLHKQNNFNSNAPKTSKKVIKTVNSKLNLYRSGMPLDYILGSVTLLGLKLKLNKNILIPRPETVEWLIEIDKKLSQKKLLSNENETIYKLKIYQQNNLALNNFLSLKDFSLVNKNKNLLVDIGCGSGLIGLYLAKHFSRVVLTDYSNKVLKIAKENAEINKVRNVQFFKSNLLSNTSLKTCISNKLYTLIANLPYVPELENRLEYKTNLEMNKIIFEPSKAIFSGHDGLDLFRKLIKQITKNPSLKPVEIVLELDPRNIFEAKKVLQNLYNQTFIYEDSVGNLRLLHGYN